MFYLVRIHILQSRDLKRAMSQLDQSNQIKSFPMMLQQTNNLRLGMTPKANSEVFECQVKP